MRRKRSAEPPVTENDTGIFCDVKIGPARNKAEATGFVRVCKEIIVDQWPIPH
jgi:hypothetical protein